MRNISIGILLAFIAKSSLATDVNEKNCEEGASNMAQVRLCVFELLEMDLSREFSATYQHVNAHDPEAANLLNFEQGAWRAYSQASCEYATKARQSDLMANDALSNCWAEFIEARIKALKLYRRNFGKAE